MTTREAVQAVFIRVLGLPADSDPAGWKFAEVAGWDSLAHMELVASLEDEFGIVLDTDAVIDLNSFEAAVAMVERHASPS